MGCSLPGFSVHGIFQASELEWVAISFSWEAPKQFPKRNLHQKKGNGQSFFGSLLPVWSTTALWIPAKPLHLRGMPSKLKRCTENCNACSQHWSTERAQFSKTTPESILHNQCFKSWTNWATKFSFIRHVHLTSHQPTTTSATTFCRENASTTSRKQKMLSKSPSNPKAWIFYATGINFLLIGKSVLIVMVPVLINKDALEPRYNDLKFMVQTYNNVCTNLIFIWWLQVLVAACELSWGMWGPDPRPWIGPCPLYWECRHWDSRELPHFPIHVPPFQRPNLQN